MDKFWKSVLINVVVIYGISFFASAVGKAPLYLFLPIIIAAIELLVAMVLLIPSQSRQSAKIMLAASGITLLIGLGVCSLIQLST